MNSQDTMTIAAAVVALVQLAKWSGVPSSRAPALVALAALLGVLLWIFAHGGPDRSATFDYFASWILVSSAAAGVYGFTKSIGHALARGSGEYRPD